MKPHNFQSDLQRSLVEQDEPYWQDLYQRFFGCAVQLYQSLTDGPGQHFGIDRMVVLENGHTYFVDEKVRYSVNRQGSPYQDILLEYSSACEYQTLGWVNKFMLADYIAYVNKPLNTCYMLHVPELQRVWRCYGEGWTQKYQVIKVPNEGYTTLCVAIPVKELYSCMDQLGHLPLLLS